MIRPEAATTSLLSEQSLPATSDAQCEWTTGKGGCTIETNPPWTGNHGLVIVLLVEAIFDASTSLQTVSLKLDSTETVLLKHYHYRQRE